MGSALQVRLRFGRLQTGARTLRVQSSFAYPPHIPFRFVSQVIAGLNKMADLLKVGCGVLPEGDAIAWHVAAHRKSSALLEIR